MGLIKKGIKCNKSDLKLIHNPMGQHTTGTTWKSNLRV